MLVKNSMETAINTAYAKQTASVADKKEIWGEKTKAQEPEKAAELTLSGKLYEVAEENVRSSQSDVLDVTKADEMIRQANQNILKQADDALKVQSGQTAASVMELLK